MLKDSINQYIIEIIDPETGIPQSSVLGFVLYPIYTYEMRWEKHNEKALLADGCSHYRSAEKNQTSEQHQNSCWLAKEMKNLGKQKQNTNCNAYQWIKDLFVVARKSLEK